MDEMTRRLVEALMRGSDMNGYGPDTASNNAALPEYMQQRTDAYGRRAAAGGIMAGLGGIASTAIPPLAVPSAMVGLDALAAWGDQGRMQDGRKMWSGQKY